MKNIVKLDWLEISFYTSLSHEVVDTLIFYGFTFSILIISISSFILLSGKAKKALETAAQAATIIGLGLQAYQIKQEQSNNKNDKQNKGSNSNSGSNSGSNTDSNKSSTSDQKKSLLPLLHTRKNELNSESDVNLSSIISLPLLPSASGHLICKKGKAPLIKKVVEPMGPTPSSSLLTPWRGHEASATILPFLGITLSESASTLSQCAYVVLGLSVVTLWTLINVLGYLTALHLLSISKFEIKYPKLSFFFKYFRATSLIYVVIQGILCVTSILVLIITSLLFI